MGEFPHKLTDEERARGRENSAKVRAERAKSARELWHEWVERDAEEQYEAYQKAWREGDWRAADAIQSRVFGKPATTIVGDADQPVTFVLDSLLKRAAEADELSQSPDPDDP